jgi:glycosyltransferase involved in cell wall biosynthesis
MPRIVVIIPAYNEENAIAKVINDIPKNIITEIIVINNNSSDQTTQAAQAAGAMVLQQPVQGYGNACLKGLEYLANMPQKPDIVVFLDADYSDYPAEMPIVLQPILEGKAQLVIGSRALGSRQQGSMTPQQIVGNWLAVTLIRWFYGVKYTDLGPFRAITYAALLQINMQDTTYGWTVEMQLKAAKLHIPATEVAVSYRQRIGFSKISGTVKGTILAGYKIITTIFKYL